MKKILIILILMLIPLSVNAGVHDIRLENCTQLSMLAEKVMKIRQQGEPLSTFIKSVHNNEMLTDLAMKAYKRPMFRTENFQNIVINEFRDRTFMTCMGR